MTPVFLDTAGLIAIWNSADQWHNAAHQAYVALKRREITLYTTSFVLLECGNAASRKPFRGSVLRLREQLLVDNCLIFPSDSDCQQAWSDYERGFPGDAGIVDCVSFVVMRRFGIAEAFTNDHHSPRPGSRLYFEL